MDIHRIPPERLPEILMRLPESRRSKAMSFRFEADRLRSAAAGLLARHALSLAGLSDTALYYAENGRPMLTGDRNLFLSLSHSGDYAACVLSPAPIAVDIQEHEGGHDAVLRRCYTEEERTWVNAAPTQQERIVRFYVVWVKKECRMKLQDFTHLREIDTMDPEPGRAYALFPMPGYSCAVYGDADLLPAAPEYPELIRE